MFRRFPVKRVVNCADENGRVKWVSGSKLTSDCVNNTGPTSSAQAFAYSISYAAGGGMAQWTLGNGKIGAAAYNDRGQPTRMRMGTGNAASVACGTTGDEWCIELGYGSISSINNGNIREQKIWAKKSTGAFLNVQQTFGYDTVNRLDVFQETVLGGGSSGGAGSQTNGYDRYGNRWASATAFQGFGAGRRGYAEATERLQRDPVSESGRQESESPARLCGGDEGA